MLASLWTKSQNIIPSEYQAQLGENEFVIKGLSYITALFSEFAMRLKLQPAGWAKSSSPYNKYKYILITKHSQVFWRHVNLQIY